VQALVRNRYAAARFVQNIYRGWSLFGIVLTGALIANGSGSRAAPPGRAVPPALFAFFCVGLFLSSAWLTCVCK
jgi:hypothetical protein